DPSAVNAVAEYTYVVSDPRFEVVDSLLKLAPDQSVPDSATSIPLNVTATNVAGLSVTTSFALNTESTVVTTIDFGGKTKATYTDAQGNLVTIALAGPG